MGEPLANFRNVVPALQILLDDFGFDLSRRRVTLSTSGLVPQIYRLAEETNVALAVSLHAPDDELRNELVPINRKHPIAELLQACWHYLDEQNGRSVTFEYVMLEGVNDAPAQARALARLLHGHPAKVNLIPFNPFPGTRYARSPAPAIQRFRDELSSAACSPPSAARAAMTSTRPADSSRAGFSTAPRYASAASSSASRFNHEQTHASLAAASGCGCAWPAWRPRCC